MKIAIPVREQSLLLVACLLALVMFFALAPGVRAKEGSISVHPSKENVSVAPGKTIKRSLLIVNSSDTPVTLKVSVNDFRVTDQKGKIEFYASEDPYPAKKWLVPQYNIVTIPALNSKKMEYLVAVDKEMPGRGYAGAIVFQTYDIKNKTAGGEPFGTLVRLNVLGQGITTGGSITSFTNSALQFTDPVNFGVTIKNASNSNLLLEGDVIISNIFGKEVGRFNTGQIDIYPNSLRNIEFNWSEAPIFGAYLATINLVDQMRKDNIVSSQTLLVFLPWQKLLIVAFVMLLGIALAIFVYRKYSPKFLPQGIPMMLKKLFITRASSS